MGPLFVWDIEFIQNIYCIFCGRVCIRELWFLPSCMFRVRVCGRPLETYVRMYVRPFSTKRRGKRKKEENIGEPAPAGLDARDRESAPAGLDARTYVRTYSARISVRKLVPVGLNVRTYARTSPRESAPAGLDARTYVRTYSARISVRLRELAFAGLNVRTYLRTYARSSSRVSAPAGLDTRTYCGLDTRTYCCNRGLWFLPSCMFRLSQSWTVVLAFVHVSPFAIVDCGSCLRACFVSTTSPPLFGIPTTAELLRLANCGVCLRVCICVLHSWTLVLAFVHVLSAEFFASIVF